MGFKGSNEINLNEDTMVAAVQHYFNTVLFAEGKAPVVAAVKPGEKRGGYQSAHTFTIETREPEVSAA